MIVLDSSHITKNEWNDWIQQHPHGRIQQAWEWGDLQRQEGRSVERFLFRDDSEIIAAAQTVVYPLPLGRSYCYIPRGPVFSREISKSKREETLTALHTVLASWAQLHSALFIRIDPPISTALQSDTLRPAVRARTAASLPRAEAILDCSLPQQQILAGMKEKTRYNIRLSERKGVTTHIIPAADVVDGPVFDRFIQLLRETARRAEFQLHPIDHYRFLLEEFVDDGFVAEAEYDGTVLASAFVVPWGKQAEYLHGGSSRRQPHRMAGYAVQWAAIRESRRRGCKTYNMGGIATDGYRTEWEGLTRFKLGFGVTEHIYAGPFDIVLSRPWYWIYNFIRIIQSFPVSNP